MASRYLSTEEASEKWPSALIESGARIATICARYKGNIIPYKDHIDIRIGCEIHPPEYWAKHGKAKARYHHEREWWESTGKRMLTFLREEAKQYAEKYQAMAG